jgi:4-hydroxy-tetrahydrodipicolinate synthase
MFAIGRHILKFSGYAPALPTPFTDDGRVDGDAFERLCDLQIESGANALVVGGTTGEAPNLSAGEHRELIHIAAGISCGRVPVIAGAGSNSTAHAVELSKDAEDSGADAILSIVPYYNKPTQEGLYAHFCAIAAATELPIILYDVPSRTARGLADETVARLAALPQIIGLKDATGDAARLPRLRSLVGADFKLLSGDDATAAAFIVQGGDGCISVVSNLAPGLCRNMFLAYRQGPVTRAQRLALPIARLTAALSCETNPVPLKYALSLLGLMSPTVRLPLVELGAQQKQAIAGVLARLSNGYEAGMVGTIDEPEAVSRRPAMAG